MFYLLVAILQLIWLVTRWCNQASQGSFHDYILALSDITVGKILKGFIQDLLVLSLFSTLDHIATEKVFA